LGKVLVSDADFDVSAEIAALRYDGSTGGIGCFVGVVRDAGPCSLAALQIEHYPGMTERAISGMVEHAEARFGLNACTVVHRYGRLKLGAQIVLVLTASAHRAAALEATAFLMDWLKTEAPFWKCEHYADGRAHWVAARDEDHVATGKWFENTK